VFSDLSSEVKVVRFVRDGQCLPFFSDRFQHRRCHSVDYVTQKWQQEVPAKGFHQSARLHHVVAEESAELISVSIRVSDFVRINF
jgi:hypothetical protein